MSHAVTAQKGDALIPAVSADQHQDSEPQTTLLTKPLQLASTATDPILTHLTSKPSHYHVKNPIHSMSIVILFTRKAGKTQQSAFPCTAVVTVS